jgi:hypothetical protein
VGNGSGVDVGEVENRGKDHLPCTRALMIQVRL